MPGSIKGTLNVEKRAYRHTIVGYFRRTEFVVEFVVELVGQLEK
jgi:hypothetical protein